MRFSPPLSSLGASERFSPKDLFIQILYFLRDNRGASLRFSPSLSALGASERFSSRGVFFFFDDQGVAGTEAEPCSITNTDFSTASMKSYLERGFL